MVKGVNKTIIEINNTENEYFDRILLFVNARHTAGGEKLDNEVLKVSQSFSQERLRIPLRTLNAKKRRRKWIFGISGLLLVACIIAAFIL